MIDYDRTLSILGVDVNELSHGSVKKVFAVCDECGTYRKLPYQAYRDLCVSCSCVQRWRVYKPKIVKVCEWCQEEYEIMRSKAEQSRFCSRKCKDTWRSKNVRGEESWLWKPRIIKICAQCGKEYEVIPSLIKISRFCSNKCRGEWQSINKCGENNPNYGIVPTEETRQRMSAGLQKIPYEEWESYAKNRPYCPRFNEACKESNREKYGRECFICGLHESDNLDRHGKMRKLSVHHVDMNKNQGCDGVRWRLIPVCLEHHNHSKLWEARIIYLLENVWTSVTDQWVWTPT